MMRTLVPLIVVFTLSSVSNAQGIVGDLLAGKLVNPTVGQWAWYDLAAGKGEKQFVVRQAIVGEEKVGRKKGYWVEFEIVPEVGFRAVYKMLLTGPASSPENIIRVIEKNGPEPAVEIEVDQKAAEAARPPEPERKLVGAEKVATLEGEVQAEHFEIQSGGKKMDVWINEKVNPSGIVKLKSIDGEMTLRNHGDGGEYASSVIKETPLTPRQAAERRESVLSTEQPEVQTHTGTESEPKPGQ